LSRSSERRVDKQFAGNAKKQSFSDVLHPFVCFSIKNRKINMTRLGRLFIAIAMVAFGVQHFIYLNFVTRLVPPLPAWIPGQAFLASLFGAFLIAAGIAIIVGIEARTMALLLGGTLLLSFVVLYLPSIFATPRNGSQWTRAGKALALSGGSFLIAGSIPVAYASLKGFRAMVAKALERFIPLGRFFLAAFLMLGGILHFIYAQRVSTLVPAWIPWHMFWTYFSGCALIAGGLGIIVPWTTRLAATLSAGMIFIWFVTLHIPRALANLRDANETTAVFEALAMSGVAVLIATNPTGRRKTIEDESGIAGTLPSELDAHQDASSHQQV
jgi:uncharacterized membrane protein